MRVMAKMGVAAVAQFTATSCKVENFSICSQLAKEAVARGASLLALPECFNFLGSSWPESVAAAEDIENGESIARYKELAKDQKLWLSLGGLQEKVPDDASKIYNTHLIISSDGEVKSVYRKIHLFDVEVPNGPVLLESRFTKPGNEVVTCASTPIGTLGLSTCYDLRFPELYTDLVQRGSDVLLVPSAFTVPTGKAHWEVLLRARAIENQTYVLAAAQVGQHNAKRQSYGHAMIIDPWGKVLADAGGTDSPTLITAPIDLAYLESVRLKMPIALHRQQSKI